MSERRLEVECSLECPTCSGIPYRIYRRQNVQPTGEVLGTFEHVLWPTSPTIAPPIDPQRIVCPDCGEALRRVAA